MKVQSTILIALLIALGCEQDRGGVPTTPSGDVDGDSDSGSDTSDIDTDTDYELDSDTNEINKLALVVGISDYAGTMEDLTFCDEDASDWANYLLDRGYEVKVLGDGHPAQYPLYHGIANRGAVQIFIEHLIESADANDFVAIAFSGHGSGYGNGGAVFITQDGVAFKDTELVTSLEVNPDVGQLFLTFDSCNAGGFGPKILAMKTDADVHVNSTCSAIGLGWDDSTLQNGAWTGTFLDLTLLEAFEGNNVAVEEAFAHAVSIYEYDGADRPELYDGNKKFDFYLNTGAKSWLQNETPARTNSNSTLAKSVSGAVTVIGRRISRNIDFPGDSAVSTLQIRGLNEIGHLRQYLDPTQTLSPKASRCLFSHSFDFLDKAGNILGRVGLCDANRTGRDHPGVFVRYAPSGETTQRLGLVVREANELVRAMDSRLKLEDAGPLD